jgi:hypothetical protein
VPNLKEVDAIRHLDPIEPPHTFIRLSIIGAPSGTHGSSTLDQAPNIQHWLVPVVREAGAARQLLGAVRFGDATELLGELVSANPESTPAWGLLLRTHVSGGDPMGAVEASREWLESGASGAPSAADVQTLERSVAANGDAGYWSWMLGRLNTELEADTHVSHMDLAAANAGMGNDDAAITHLAAALAAAEPACSRCARIQSGTTFAATIGSRVSCVKPRTSASPRPCVVGEAEARKETPTITARSPKGFKHSGVAVLSDVVPVEHPTVHGHVHSRRKYL